MIRVVVGIVAALLLAAWLPLQAGDAPFALRGAWEQGGVLVGKSAPGSRVWLNGRALRLTAAGDFVFGLDRDEKPDAELRFQATPDAPVQSFHFAVAKREYEIQRLEGLPPGMVNPPAKVLERIRSEQAQVAAARGRDTPGESFLESFAWPCTGRISGVFGSQRILNGQPKQPHYGVDVAVPPGTPVHAPASGIVSLANPDMYYTGGTLMIDHGHGLSSAFLHLSKLLVKVGDEVKQGQVVAMSGATGRVTGPHLDWRMNWLDARVDAQRLVPPMPDSTKRP